MFDQSVRKVQKSEQELNIGKYETDLLAWSLSEGMTDNLVSTQHENLNTETACIG